MAAFFTLLLGVSVAIVSHLMFSSHPSQVAGIVVIALMSTVVLVSFIISHFVVSRINSISQTARNIMDTGDLSQRIQINTNWDDLSNLAQVLNRFLDRNEALMDGIREVSNNIAHDLRTPLTHLRNQIEEMKSRQIQEHDIDELLNEADQILAIFNSLLRISNIEKGKRYQAFEEIELHALLSDVVELFEPVAEEKNIHIQLKKSSDVTIQGDRHLLFQMFANLLSNAVKFSPIGSDVIISATPFEVIVADRGTGIADAEKELVFRRFYRSDTSRSTEGNGLGLSLVKAIVALHQGSIMLEDNHPGLRVRVKL